MSFLKGGGGREGAGKGSLEVAEELERDGRKDRDVADGVKGGGEDGRRRRGKGRTRKRRQRRGRKKREEREEEKTE